MNQYWFKENTTYFVTGASSPCNGNHFLVLKFSRLLVSFASRAELYLNEIAIIGRAKRAPHWGVQSRFRVIYIGECGSTLYVGLSGIVRNLIQKSTG